MEKLSLFAVSCLLAISPMNAQKVESLSTLPQTLPRLELQNPQRPVRHAARAAEGMATVTFRNNADRGEGRGYQLLLDAQAETYSLYYSTDEKQFSGSSYNLFEYTFPEGATMSVSDGKFMKYNEEMTVEIPAGVYDYVVIDPVNYNGSDLFYIADGGDGCGNDFQIVAGLEYIFQVNWDDSGEHVVIQKLASTDLALSDLTVTKSGGDLYSDAESVSVKLTNMATQAFAGDVKLELTVNGVSTVETLSAVELAIGESKDYTFTAKANLSSGGYHSVSVKLLLDSDLVADNDTVSTTMQNNAPFTPPVMFTFDTKEDADLWIVDDKNGDKKTWAYTSYKGNYCMMIRYHPENAHDDYMTISLPVKLTKGTNNISFDYSSYSSYAESFEVLAGENPDPSTMTNIATFTDFKTSGYNTAVIEFELEADQEIYFSFHATSAAFMDGICIDNIKIDKGPFAGAPDLYLERVLLPEPSPVLTGDEKISVLFTNYGTGDLASLKFLYSVNGGEPVEESFTLETPLQPGEGTTLTFTKGIDMSALGEYEVEIEAIDVISSTKIPELSTVDNGMTSSTRKMPTIDPPLATNFKNGDSFEQWSSLDNAWQYDPMFGTLVGAEEIAFNSCGINLISGQEYRFEMEHCTGTYYMGSIPMFVDYKIIFGKAGTDRETWTVVCEYEQLYTENLFINETFSITPTEDGIYQFAIVPGIGGNGSAMYVNALAVEKAVDYSARVTNAVAPTMVPLEQTKGFGINVEFVNKGQQISDITLNVKNGETIVGSYSANAVESLQSDTVWVATNLDGAKVNDVYNLSIVPSVEGVADAITSGVEVSGINVTPTTLAYDKVTEEMLNDTNGYYKIGLGEGEPIICALPFHISSTDILTGITIGWAGPEACTIPIRVFRYDPATVTPGDEILNVKVEKEEGVGFTTYSLPTRELVPGDYFAAVEIIGYLMSCDLVKEGTAYIFHEFYNMVVSQKGFGNLGIRLEFDEGTAAKTDFAISGIPAPVASKILSVNEPVTAIVRNMGSTDGMGVVTLTVDGKEIGSQNVELHSYSEKAVTFTADLSVVGEHSIEFAVAIDGDENIENNTMSKTVFCRPIPSPYTLDFEDCEDFQIETFLPAWTTVDVDQAGTYNIAGITFLHTGEPCGFMVFNPYATTPALMDDPERAGYTPYEGERYGAVFCSKGCANNDWLISPKLRMADTDAAIKFYARTYDSAYGLEKFKVLVSETDNNTESFTVVLDTQEVPDEWTEVVVPLDAYAGKDVHVAIQCVSNDKFIFMIDDISITEYQSGINDVTTTDVILNNDQANETVTVRCSAEIEGISFYSMSGVAVYANDNVASSSFSYNTSALAAGVYLARIEMAQGVVVKRFVVK